MLVYALQIFCGLNVGMCHMMISLSDFKGKLLLKCHSEVRELDWL
jgi:hypothetical protein